jgi:hypothetical protein
MNRWEFILHGTELWCLYGSLSRDRDVAQCTEKNDNIGSPIDWGKAEGLPYHAASGRLDPGDW